MAPGHTIIPLLTTPSHQLLRSMAIFRTASSHALKPICHGAIGTVGGVTTVHLADPKLATCMLSGSYHNNFSLWALNGPSLHIMIWSHLTGNWTNKSCWPSNPVCME